MASRQIKADTFEDVEKLLLQYVEREREMHTPIKRGEISQKMFAATCGFSPDKAARILEGYVLAGTWTKRPAMINGRKGIAYRPVKAPKGK